MSNPEQDAAPTTSVLVMGVEGDSTVPIEPSPVSREDFEELRNRVESHVNNTANPHQTTAHQVDAVPRLEFGQFSQDLARRLTIKDKADLKRSALLALSLLLNIICLFKAF